MDSQEGKRTFKMRIISLFVPRSMRAIVAVVRICILTFAVLPALGGDNIEAASIQVGTLEPRAGPKSGYIFRPEIGKEQVFEANLGEGPPRESVIPNLPEVGWKLDNGVEYYYKTVAGIFSELALARRAIKEHPERKLAARIFMNHANGRLEILTVGRTPVFRLDMTINGQKITIWLPRNVVAPEK
jgi:hypothetical protein